MAPKLFGGVAGKTPVEGIGVELPSEAVELKYTDICQIGEDIRIKCQVCDKKTGGIMFTGIVEEKGKSPLYTADRGIRDPGSESPESPGRDKDR